jgi:hypothetical protein
MHRDVCYRHDDIDFTAPHEAKQKTFERLRLMFGRRVRDVARAVPRRRRQTVRSRFSDED